MPPGRKGKKGLLGRGNSVSKDVGASAWEGVLWGCWSTRSLVWMEEGKDGNGDEARKTGWSQGVRSIECST